MMFIDSLRCMVSSYRIEIPGVHPRIRTMHNNVNCPKETIKGSSTAGQGDSSDQVHSDQTVLGTVRWEAGPCERWPRALKAKLIQCGPSSSNPLRSDGSCNGQVGDQT
jgi:hypothetical protein